jgi:regulator of sigma E protease
MIITLLVFLIILSLLVLIHEAGHFFVAKKLGIKVEEFGYGLPPRAWGKRIGETLYSINWLPFGGFVKLYGEDEAGSGSVKVEKKELPTKDVDRAFFSRSVPQRAAVVVAGVVMNALLAVVIYYIFLGMSGFKAEIPLLGDFAFFGVNQTNISEIIITGTQPGSPAEKARIPEASRVTAINGARVKSAEELSTLIREHTGKEITLSWENTQTFEKGTATLTPRVHPPKGQGALGISFFPVETAVLEYKTPVQKTLSGVIHPANLMAYQLVIIKQFIVRSVAEKSAEPIGTAVSGPVGIYNVVGTFIKIPDAKERVLQLLNLTGLLSLSLAFFNVLPIPALDGGRLFFILIEGITRRKVSPKFEAMAHTIGMAVLLTLILLVTFKDIWQLFR